MNIYIYAADIYCERCGEAIKKRLTRASVAPTNPDDETTFDSSHFPKGPYEDGGGAADSPQHCGMGEYCLNPTVIGEAVLGKFLENNLTNDGVVWLMDQEETPVVKFWRDFYRQKGYNL
jgi:hypothetical protein